MTSKPSLPKSHYDIYSKLTPWQKTLVARHPQRPYTLDFIGSLFEEWTEIHGDRKFGDDPAIVSGFRPLPRRAVRRDRPSEGAEHQGEDPPQLRPAASRGVPQGAAGHEARREVQPAHLHLHRHPGRLSRCRRGRAGTGRGHRREPARDGRAAGAGDRQRDRGRGERRRAGARASAIASSCSSTRSTR